MRALVVGASGGIGSALVAGLEARGAEVTGLSRSRDGLDLTDEASVARVLGALTPPYQMILVASGALELEGHGPEKSLRALDPAASAAQFALNALGPLLVLKHALHLLLREEELRFAVLSARLGSIGDNRLGGWYSYRAAKAALNQLVHSAAIELARSHPRAILVSLHPGTVDTALSARHRGSQPAVPPAEAAERLLQVLGGLTPEDSGGFFDSHGLRLPW